jgi:hypothetical protein
MRLEFSNTRLAGLKREYSALAATALARLDAGSPGQKREATLVMFDWITFLRSRHIHYVTSGANVAKNCVAIHCPFCGRNDPSHHMGINLLGKGWGCWRSKDHRGINPVRLVAALLNCSFEQAEEIAGVQLNVPTNLADLVRAKLRPKSVPIPTHKLEMPKEFKTNWQWSSARMFVDYLERRGLATKQVKVFGLRYCTEGVFKGRIIFPIYFQKKLVSWTGRTVYPSAELRYYTLSAERDRAERDGYEPALGPLPDYLLWWDQLLGWGDTIFLCEGPFDALKINVLGNQYGVCGTCFFTSGPSNRQIELLHQLLPKFRRRYLLLDRGTVKQTAQITGQLIGLGLSVANLPHQVKDPGEFTKNHMEALLRSID